jgi:putative transposase
MKQTDAHGADRRNHLLPNEAWMKQTARKLTDAQDGFLRSVRYLILDRDPLYTTAFRGMLRDSGVRPLLLPARSRLV